MTMFAVMGVTGQVGLAVVNTLIGSWHEVRVIVRREAKARRKIQGHNTELTSPAGWGCQLHIVSPDLCESAAEGG